MPRYGFSSRLKTVGVSNQYAVDLYYVNHTDFKKTRSIMLELTASNVGEGHVDIRDYVWVGLLV